MIKPPKLDKRWRVLLPALIVVGLAALLLPGGNFPEWVLPRTDDTVDTVSAVIRERAAVVAPAPEAGAGEAATAIKLASGPVDIFAVRTWEPPPPPPDLSPPPPPQPPPLPFRFIGKVVEPGKKVAFMLAEGQRIHVVSVGDSIGTAYRVESFENGQLFLRYRPMNVRQALDVRSNS